MMRHILNHAIAALFISVSLGHTLLYLPCLKLPFDELEPTVGLARNVHRNKSSQVIVTGAWASLAINEPSTFVTIEGWSIQCKTKSQVFLALLS